MSWTYTDSEGDEIIRDGAAVSDAEAEAVIDRRVQRRLANDAAYRNAENADEQAEREAQITREEEDRFYYGRVLND